MIFKSALVTTASGKLGGIVFSHNRGGSYMRSLRIPVNRRSGFQEPVRSAFAYLMSRWKDLTPTQRDGWDTYAQGTPVTNALGDSILLTGAQMYMRVNTAIVTGNLIVPIFDNPPSVIGLAPVSPMTGQFDASANSVTVNFNNADDWAATDGGVAFIYTGRPQPSSHNFNQSSFRLASFILGDTMTPPTTPAVISPVPFAVTNFSGGNCWFAYSVVDATGRPSNRVQVACTIVP